MVEANHPAPTPRPSMAPSLDRQKYSQDVGTSVQISLNLLPLDLWNSVGNHRPDSRLTNVCNSAGTLQKVGFLSAQF